MSKKEELTIKTGNEKMTIKVMFNKCISVSLSSPAGGEWNDFILDRKDQKALIDFLHLSTLPDEKEEIKDCLTCRFIEADEAYECDEECNNYSSWIKSNQS